MKKGTKIILGIVVLLACLGGATTCILCVQKDKIAGLEATIHLLEAEQVPMKFRVTARTEDSVGLRVKFYNADGDEIGKPLDLSLKGKELSFDFIVIKARSDEAKEERYLAFPFRIFTDAIPAAEGRLLFDEYDSEGMPMVFASKEAPAELKQALMAAFARVRGLDLGAQDFGSMVHDIDLADISRPFLEGVTYKIVARAKGGLEVMED